jgi:hypothetical protein
MCVFVSERSPRTLIASCKAKRNYSYSAVSAGEDSASATGSAPAAAADASSADGASALQSTEEKGNIFPIPKKKI